MEKINPTTLINSLEDKTITEKELVETLKNNNFEFEENCNEDDKTRCFEYLLKNEPKTFLVEAPKHKYKVSAFVENRFYSDHLTSDEKGRTGVKFNICRELFLKEDNLKAFCEYLLNPTENDMSFLRIQEELGYFVKYLSDEEDGYFRYEETRDLVRIASSLNNTRSEILYKILNQKITESKDLTSVIAELQNTTRLQNEYLNRLTGKENDIDKLTNKINANNLVKEEREMNS